MIDVSVDDSSKTILDNHVTYFLVKLINNQTHSKRELNILFS